MCDRTRSGTVLIVDDEIELTDLFEIWLSPRYEVRTAYDGEQALAQVDDSVDVAFLDRRMPGQSGDEVARLLIEKHPRIRIVFVSGEHFLSSPDTPFDSYLTKPVDRDDLIAVADELVDGRSDGR